MILVTGGTGFVGRHLIEMLCARGQQVRVLARDPSRARELSAGWGDDGVRPEFVDGNVLEPASLDRAMVGATSVVHLAASVPGAGARDDRLAVVNVQGTAHLARAALGAGIRRLVHCSSAGVYGDGFEREPHREDSPLNGASAYERSKIGAEHALRQILEGSQVDMVVLRIAGVHGGGRPSTLAFFEQVLHRHLWLHVPPIPIVHPTYVGDVVQAIVRGIERCEAAGRTFNVAGERALSYPELIELTGKLLETGVRQVVLPAGPGRAVAAIVGTGCRLMHRPVPVAVARRRAAVVNRSLDTSLARRVLDFSPAPLDETLRETIGWYRQRGLLDGRRGSGRTGNERRPPGGLLSGGGPT